MADTKEAKTEQSKTTIDAVYEHGVFRVLDANEVSIPDGQRVRITVELATSKDVLDLMLHFYDGTSEEEIQEIEKIALDRRDLFEGRRAG